MLQAFVIFGMLLPSACTWLKVDLAAISELQFASTQFSRLHDTYTSQLVYILKTHTSGILKDSHFA